MFALTHEEINITIATYIDLHFIFDFVKESSHIGINMRIYKYANLCWSQVSVEGDGKF